MALQLPEACIGAQVFAPTYMRSVLDYVIGVIFTTDRGDFTRDPVTGEVLFHLELIEEDHEQVPILAREGAEEIWLVLASEEEIEDPASARSTICVHGRIEYLCPLCFTMENY